MSDLRWKYDESADVLHITSGSDVPCYGEPLENFENVIILIKNEKTDELIGFRVLGAKANNVQLPIMGRW